MTFLEASVEYDKAEDAEEEAWRKAYEKPSWPETQAFIRPFKIKRQNAYALVLSLASLEDCELSPKDSIGNYYELKDFIGNCGVGFIDYDGFGKLCVGNQQSSFEVSPSLFKNKNLHLPAFFDGVMWYNR